MSVLRIRLRAAAAAASRGARRLASALRGGVVAPAPLRWQPVPVRVAPKAGPQRRRG
jgi:hypothetical protein